jgi:rsbT co-antagonist protein RsbR
MRALIDKLYVVIRRVRITRRLLGIIFVLLVAELAVTTGLGFMTQQQLAYLQYLETERLPVDRLIQQAALEIASSQVVLSEYVAGREPDPKAANIHISETKNALTRAKLDTTDAERRGRLEELLEQVERYSSSVDKLHHAKLAENEAQVVHYGAEVQRLGDRLRAEALRVVQESTEQAQEDVRQAVHTFRQRGLIGAIAFLPAFVVLTIAAYMVARSVIRPIREIQQATQRMERGEWEQPLSEAAADELGDLARSFNAMARSLRASRAEIEEHAQTLEQRVEKRTQALGEMVRTQQRLLETIREMSVPVVPIMVGVIVLPLVGTIDSERAGRVVEALLEGIEAHRARVALVDITGVPVVDTQVAHLLLEATTAARLLGTQVVLVGIRPEVAQTIVGLGIDLSEIVTRADLQSGVEYALRATGRDTRSGSKRIGRGV